MAILIMGYTEGTGPVQPPGFSGTPTATASLDGSPRTTAMAQLSPTTFILAARYITGANIGVNVAVASVSGTTVTWGPWLSVSNTASCAGHVCRVAVEALDASRAIVLWPDATSDNIKAEIVSISGTTVTGNSEFIIHPTSTDGNPDAAVVDTDKIFVTWDDTSSGDPRNRAVVLTATGTTLSAGTTISWNGQSFDRILAASHPNRRSMALDTSTVLVNYPSSGGPARSFPFSISGTTITPGTSAVIDSWGQAYKTASYPIDSTRALHIWADGNNGYKMYAAVTSVSGTTASVGTKVEVSANSVNNVDDMDIYYATTDKMVITYKDDVTGKQTIQTLSISGTTVTAGTEVELSATTMDLGRLITTSSTTGFFTYRAAGEFYGVTINY